MKKESKKEAELKIAGNLYATAYGTHHMGKDPTKALKLYREFISKYPNAKEAGYAQTQINAILRSGYTRPNTVVTQADESSTK